MEQPLGAELRGELTGIAARLAGGRVDVDISYTVSAAAYSRVTVTAATAETALVRFIARLLDERAEAEVKAEAEDAGAERGPAQTVKRAGVIGEDGLAFIRANAQLTAREIAGELGVSETTIAAHLTRIRRELGVSRPGGQFRRHGQATDDHA